MKDYTAEIDSSIPRFLRRLASERQSKIFALLFFLLVQILWLVVVFQTADQRLLDFRTFDTYAFAVAKGFNPYLMAPSDLDALAISRWQLHVATAVLYPPILVFLLIPLTYLPPMLSALVWSSASVFAFALSGMFLSKLRRGNWVDPLVFFGQAVFAPVLITLASGQVNAFVLLCMVIALFALNSNRDAVAGWAIAIGILLKVIPIGFCAWLFWKQKWKPLAWTGITLLMLFLVSLPLIRTDIWLDYVLSATSPVGLSTVHTYPENVSLWTFFARLFPSQFAYDLAKTLSGLVLAIIVGVLWHSRHTLTHSLGISLIISGLMLIAPSSWLHWQVFLLIPFVVLLRDLKLVAEPRITPTHAAVLASYGLLQIQALIWRQFIDQPLIGSMGTYGIVVLFIVLVWRIMRGATTELRQVN